MVRRQALVILEGMDNTGKSTLARRLERDLGVVQRHSQGKPETSRIMFDRVWDILASKQVGIYDRFHAISERVYGPILRDVNYYDWEEGRQQIEALKWTNHLIIYCRPTRDTIFETLGDRDQMMGVIRHHRKLLEAYDNLFAHELKHRPWNTAIYDYTNPDSYEEIKLMVEEFIYGKVRNHLQ